MLPINPTTNASGMHPLTEAALNVGQNLFKTTPTPYSAVPYAPHKRPSVLKTAVKSVMQATLAYYPVKWATRKMGMRAPGFLGLVLGVFGLHTAKRLLGRSHTLPTRHLNLAA